VNIKRRRNRLVYFRVSEEEFEQIRQACETKAARTVSELARMAVQEFIWPTQRYSEQLCDRIIALGIAVEEMKHDLHQLTLSVRETGDHVSNHQPGRTLDHSNK
jgi:hypothetical protein